MNAQIKAMSITASLCMGLLFSATTGLAEISDVLITPADPTNQDTIYFSVEGWFPDLCWSLEGFDFNQISSNEFTANIYAIDIWQPGWVCLPVIVGYQYSESFGPLEPGTYTISITEFHQSLRDPYSNYASLVFEVSGPLPSIEDLVANLSGSDLILSWTAVEGATSYNVYRAVDPFFEPGPSNFLDSIPTPSYTNSGVVPLNEKYFYIVTATR